MLTIAFLTPTINIRGTCVSIFDYAHYNEIMLNNKSIILTSKIEDDIAYKKFSNRFKTIIYSDLQKECENVDILYIIKYGRNDTLLPDNCFILIHCVFDMNDPHGNVYAGVSETLANKFNKKLYVPHMVTMKYDPFQLNMRKELDIPDNACVFGRYGGMDTFNLPYTWNVLKKILNKFDNVYILLMNTPSIIHKRVININPTTNIIEKRKFINTCNTMICPERLGHTFGLACAEFASQQKPIIVYNGSDIWNNNHINVIGDKGIYFKNEQEFENVLIKFYNEKNNYKNRKDLNVYSEFTPEKVMKQFHDVFIKSYYFHLKIENF
jgi:hypothetical protein